MSLKASVCARLASAGLAPQKRLGQNFMIDSSAVGELVAAVRAGKPLRIVEVGPGTGVLTEQLLKLGVPVAAVELDHGLAALLRQLLVPQGLTLIEGDVLASKNALHQGLLDFIGDEPWVLASNLPYDVSLPVILNALTLSNQPQHIVVTVQLEAAQRLCATCGTKAWGASAAVAQAAGHGRIIRKLPPQCFYPRPRVDSAILAWSVERSLPDGFGVWCRRLFAYRRKVIIRGLRDCGIDKDVAQAILDQCALPHDKRVEDLSVDELLQLYIQLSAKEFLS